MNIDGWRGSGRPKKIWMDCVTNDMLEKGVDDADGKQRRVEEDDVLRRPQIRWHKRRKMMMMMYKKRYTQRQIKNTIPYLNFQIRKYSKLCLLQIQITMFIQKQ